MAHLGDIRWYCGSILSCFTTRGRKLMPCACPPTVRHYPKNFSFIIFKMIRYLVYVYCHLVTSYIMVQYNITMCYLWWGISIKILDWKLLQGKQTMARECVCWWIWDRVSIRYQLNRNLISTEICSDHELLKKDML